MLKIPDHQVAGHTDCGGKLGPLVDDSGLFYKPLQSDARGSEEVTFYESFSNNTEVPEHVCNFLPVYHGTKVMKSSTGSDHPHIILQDLASSRVNPSIMDIKIGSRTWGPEALEAYISKCLKKDRESTSVTLGFRISGLQVYINDESDFCKPDRDIMRKADPDDVRVILRNFVSSNPSAETETSPDCSLASFVYGGDNGILAQLLELDKVTKSLSRQVMEHHEVMVKGMDLVGELEKDLKVANVICMNGRRHLISSRNEVSGDLIDW